MSQANTNELTLSIIDRHIKGYLKAEYELRQESFLDHDYDDLRDDARREEFLLEFNDHINWFKFPYEEKDFSGALICEMLTKIKDYEESNGHATDVDFKIRAIFEKYIYVFSEEYLYSESSADLLNI